MKGSPIIATGITIIVLLCLYLGIRAVVLPEGVQPVAGGGHGHDHHGHDHHGHDHGGHDHGSHGDGGHDDTALNTDFEIFFSSIPKSLTITQPLNSQEVLKVESFDGVEWTGSGVLNLTGHDVELAVDVVWNEPSEMNFVQIVLSPDKHQSKSATLRSDGDISDIAEFNW